MIKLTKNNKKYVLYYLKKMFPRVSKPEFLIPVKETFYNFYDRVYDDKRLNYFKTEKYKYEKLKDWYYNYQSNNLHNIEWGSKKTKYKK
jgi:hypothetical protein